MPLALRRAPKRIAVAPGLPAAPARSESRGAPHEPLLLLLLLAVESVFSPNYALVSGDHGILRNTITYSDPLQLVLVPTSYNPYLRYLRAIIESRTVSARFRWSFHAENDRGPS